VALTATPVQRPPAQIASRPDRDLEDTASGLRANPLAAAAKEHAIPETHLPIEARGLLPVSGPSTRSMKTAGHGRHGRIVYDGIVVINPRRGIPSARGAQGERPRERRFAENDLDEGAPELDLRNVLHVGRQCDGAVIISDLGTVGPVV
jgi:hypothetical protein